MPGAELTWSGLQEFRRELQAESKALQTDAQAMAIDSAFQMADAVKSAYPVVRGGLRAGVIVQQDRDGARVLTTARHAAPFEYGRQAGKHGTTPPRPTFIPLRERYQRKLIEQLMWLVEQYGMTATRTA